MAVADKLLAAALFCKKGSLALYLVCRASGDGMEPWQPEEKLHVAEGCRIKPVPIRVV